MALDYNIIGERLKKARVEKNMTQEKLAEQLDVSIAFLSRIERGSSHINLKRLTQICEILGVSEGSILNGVSSNSNNYLTSEFNEILNSVSSDKQKLIFKVLNHTKSKRFCSLAFIFLSKNVDKDVLLYYNNMCKIILQGGIFYGI